MIKRISRKIIDSPNSTRIPSISMIKCSTTSNCSTICTNSCYIRIKRKFIFTSFFTIFIILIMYNSSRMRTIPSIIMRNLCNFRKWISTTIMTSVIFIYTTCTITNSKVIFSNFIGNLITTLSWLISSPFINFSITRRTIISTIFISRIIFCSAITSIINYCKRSITTTSVWFSRTTSTIYRNTSYSSSPRRRLNSWTRITKWNT